MEYNRRIVFDLVSVLVLANLIDAYASIYLISNGVCYETNVWLEEVGRAYGFANAILALKAGWCMLLACLIDHYQSPRIGVVVILSIAASTYSVLMLWHIYLISFTTVIL